MQTLMAVTRPLRLAYTRLKKAQRRLLTYLQPGALRGNLSLDKDVDLLVPLRCDGQGKVIVRGGDYYRFPAVATPGQRGGIVTG